MGGGGGGRMVEESGLFRFLFCFVLFVDYNS